MNESKDCPENAVNKMKSILFSIGTAKEMLDYGDRFFKEHEKLIESLFSQWYEPEEIYFHEILSGDKETILSNDLEGFKKQSVDTKANLNPVVIFRKSGQFDGPVWVFIEFHSNECPW